MSRLDEVPHFWRRPTIRDAQAHVASQITCQRRSHHTAVGEREAPSRVHHGEAHADCNRDYRDFRGRLRDGSGRTALTYLYGNLLDLQNAEPGENWTPLRRLVAREPSIRACAPRRLKH